MGGGLGLQMSGWQGAQALHAEEGHAVVYKGMVDCFVRTVREEGFKALFKVRSALALLSLYYRCFGLEGIHVRTHARSFRHGFVECCILIMHIPLGSSTHV